MAKKSSSQENFNKPKTQNKFEILNSINEEGEGSGSQKKNQVEQSAEKENNDPTEHKAMDSNGSGMGDQENNTEEMEIRELDLDGI